MFENIKTMSVQIRWNRVFKCLVVAILIISIMSCTLLSAFAEADKKVYIKELKFGSADTCSKAEAKQYLTDNGYTLASSGYDMGFSNSLYLGYKTTTDPNEAITDISVMNMNGGYSFSEYEKLVKEQKEASDKIIAVLMHGVKEYRDNYAAGSPAAKYAHDMMNTYKEDDSGKLMGDFLLDTSVTENQMSTVFMQASGVHLPVIKTNLALACTPYGKDAQGKDKVSWMERLSKLGPEGVMNASSDDSLNIRAITLKEVFSLIAPDLQQYVTVQDIIVKTVGTGELTPEQEKQATQIIDENYTPDNAIMFPQFAALYAILNSFAYEDWYLPEIKTLADLVMKSQELESFDFHAMASVLTEAEYQMMSLVGAAPFINTVGNTEENWQKIRSDVAAMDLKKQPTTSIYQGVDRELFKGKVAMTSESIRANNMNSDNNMFYGNIAEAAEIALFTLMATSVATMISAIIYSRVTKTGLTKAIVKSVGKVNSKVKVNVLTCYQTMDSAEKALMRKYYPEKFTYKLTSVGKIFFSAMAVLAIIMIVFAALEIAYYFKNDYTTMPLIMMDSVMEKNAQGVPISPTLIKYNAITQQSMNIQNNYIADLNTFSGNQWIIMYTTKDKLAGTPILEKNFKITYYPTYPTENVSPIHRFGEKDAYDLKSASGFGLDVYGSFERDLDAFKVTGSVFTFNTNTALALTVGAIFGSVASVLSTIAIMKKKKKGKEALIG